MATMATNNNTSRKAALVLTLLALLSPSILGARTRPPSPPHHSQGHKRSPPAAASPPPPPPPPPPPAPAAAPAGLVSATCNSTTYYDLCMSTLGADPSSATTDVRGLSSIAVSAAAVNASGGAATAVALATTAAGSNSTKKTAVDGTTQALLRMCATKYGQARDALSAARDSIAQENYDYAAVHVSAAGEYPQVCRVLFQRQRPGGYPPELAAREQALRRLCTVALDIITLLSSPTTLAN